MDELEAFPRRPSLQDPSVALFLGLYLILLVFFILLSSISTADESRRSEAVGSVSTTFQAGGRDRPTGSSLVVEIGAGKVDDRMRGDVESTFRDALPSIEYALEVEAGAVRIVLAVDFLFLPGADNFQPDRSKFFVDLTALLESKRVGLVTEIEIVLRSGPNLPPLESEARQLLVQRAGTVARVLAARGVAANTIATGMQPGPADTIAFSFRETIEDRETVNFGDEGL